MKQHQLPHQLRGLTRNLKTGLYEVTEAEVTYSMNLEMTRDAKAFFRNNFSGRLAEWYSQLPREERAMVIRSGHQLPGDDSFYADPHYD